jgi:hypothetical protein
MDGSQEAIELRSAGFSEDEIADHMAKGRGELSAAGFSDDEISKHYGIPPKVDESPFRKFATEALDAVLDEVSGDDDPETGERPGFVDLVSRGLDKGFQSSVSGLLARGRAPDPADVNPALVQQIAHAAGVMAGDIPAMLAGFLAGGGSAVALGQAGPQALTPEEIITVPGMAFGGAVALPSGLRAALIDGYNNGSIKDPQDFIARQFGIFLETAKGYATGFTGGAVGAVAKPGAQTIASEVLGMTTVASALEGRVPTMEDFAVASATVFGIGAAVKGTAGAAAVKRKIEGIYKDTGVAPGRVAEDAKESALLRDELLSDAVEVPTAYGGGPKKPDSPDTPPATVPQKKQADVPKDVEVARKDVSDRISFQADKKSGTYSLDSLYTNAVDRFHPIKVAVDAMRGGKKLAATSDPYIQARLSVASATKGNLFLEFETRDFATGAVTGPGLRQVLSPVADDLRGFSEYAVAKRAIELDSRGIETGVPRASSKVVVKAGEAKYSKVLSDLHAFQERTLTYLVDSGILSSGAAKAMREANKDYVPFFRVMDDDATQGLGRGLRVFQPVRGIKGSERVIVDPLESIIKNTYAYIQLADRNTTVAKLADLIDSAPGGSAFGTRVKTKMGPVKVDQSEMAAHLKRYGEDAGVDLSKHDFTIFRPLRAPGKSTEVTFFRNGKRETYEFASDIAEALNGLDGDTINLMTKLMSIPASTLRAGAILDPAFFARNSIRDNITAAIYSKHGFKPLVDFASGMASLVKQDKAYKDWLFGGGAQATLVSLDRKYLRDNLQGLSKTGFLSKVPNYIKNPLEALRVMSELTENATRLGEFKKVAGGRQGKEAMQEGAFASRDVTLDFARRGKSMKAMNQITAFFGARIQGYDKMAREFKNNPARATALASMYITAPSVMLWLANHDDPRYQALPDWQRDLFWIVLTDDHIFRIPKPFELGVVFGTFPERMLDEWSSRDGDLTKKLVGALETDFVSSMIPNALTPVIEEWTNHSIFRDAPLIPARLEHLKPEDQYTEYTTETAKALGSMLARAPGMEYSKKASPIVVENYVRQWTGGLGYQALQLADKILKEAGVLVPATEGPAKTLSDIPFVRAFVVRYPSSGTQHLTDFYDNMEKIGKVQGSVKVAMERGDARRMAEIMGQDPALAVAQLGAFRRAISEHVTMVRMIHASPDLSPEEKRDLIDNLYASITDMAKAANDTFKAIKRAVE